MMIESEIEMFTEVYLITDPEQHVRQVVEMVLKGPGTAFLYGLQFCERLTFHYRQEFTTEKNHVTASS